jgi:dimethylhistidine N-methyltransferase
MITQTIPATSVSNFAAEVRAGLSKPGQKELPSKYLYDDVGSALFETITRLPEYGLTRAGERLLRRHATSLVERLELPTIVAELGSGGGKNTRWILEALAQRQRTTYFPIDISVAALEQCERELGHIDSVSIVGFERAYLDGLLEVAAHRQNGEHLLVLFLGSTIGNFDRPAGELFLKEVRGMMREVDCLLLATDLLKPVPQVLLAYDDHAGVTAASNKNLLARINRELEADFDLRKFRHVARWNESERRIEMHLQATAAQYVNVPLAALRVQLRKDETIWTESSHKYRAEELAGLAQRTGFRCSAQWTDREWPFTHSLFVAT